MITCFWNLFFKSFELCSNPIQPKSCLFPKTNGRRFNLDWYNKYPWIEYSILIDRAFCFSCRLFGHNKNDNFKKNGYKNWKDGYRNLQAHEESISHKNSHICLTQRRLTNLPIHGQVQSQYEATVLRNRSNLKTIFRVVIFLAKQGLSFRGHLKNVDPFFDFFLLCRTKKKSWRRHCSGQKLINRITLIT